MKKLSVMDVLEVRIVEYCNYRCVACGAFSNIAKKEEYGIDKYERDLSRMNLLFERINLFRIYGGEPFLTNNIEYYVKITRKILENSKIEIVTNGSLLYKVSNDLLTLLKELEIKIVISYYDDKNEFVNQGITRIDTNNMQYELIPTRHFYAVQDFTTKHNAKRARKMCVVSIASYMHDSKLYACPFPFSYIHYDKKYGTSYSNLEDGIDIYETAINSELILKKLKEPMKFCENCVHIPKYVKWQQNKPEPTDWFACDCNNRLDEGYTWYDFLVDVDKLNYIIVSVSPTGIDYNLISEKNINRDKIQVVIIDNYYSKLLYESTYKHTAMKLNLNYELLDTQTESLEKIHIFYDRFNKNFDVLLFSSDLQKKMSIVKQIRKILKMYN